MDKIIGYIGVMNVKIFSADNEFDWYGKTVPEGNWVLISEDFADPTETECVDLQTKNRGTALKRAKEWITRRGGTIL